MAIDHTMQVRRAILIALKSAQPITTLVPAAQIFTSSPPPNPPFPFIRYGAKDASPFLASGLDSSSSRISIHVFTRALLNDAGSEIVTAEDRCDLITAAVASVLGGKSITLVGALKLRLSWLGSNSTRDGADPSAWHGIIRLSGEVSG
jgi:hypothetical protein